MDVSGFSLKPSNSIEDGCRCIDANFFKLRALTTPDYGKPKYVTVAA